MIGLLLTISGLGILASIPAAARAPRLWLAGVLAWAGGGLGAAVFALSTGVVWELQRALTVGGQAIHLRLQAGRALFLALLGFGGGGRCGFGGGSLADPAH